MKPFKTKEERKKIYKDLLKRIGLEDFKLESGNTVSGDYTCWKLNNEVYGFLKLSGLGKFNTNEVLELFPEFNKAYSESVHYGLVLDNSERKIALKKAIELCS